ncbi:hypothetical protein [Balneatrix alpica]|uniref:Uncharacterized protein n=1 Tax=Balneatrix alpica TaxID=75684 RepID=A0ABV5ZHE6_9GAMM|nr:hypothetical protein [Balneatrix alpica]
MLKWGLLLLIAPMLWLMGSFWQEFMAVDACLDAGGSFDYQQLVCDHQANHPFIPFGARHSGLVNGSMLLMLLGLLLCMLGLYRRR